jgi:hypothetical protein
MRYSLTVSALAISLIAQTAPTMHEVSLTVVDSEGKPIPNARIDHSGAMVFVGAPNLPIENGTDARGKAAVKTDRHAIVIRKPGYTSYRLMIDHDGEVRVTLAPLPPPLKCEPARIPDMTTREVRDVDYAETRTYIETPEGPKGIAKGQGPNYSFGAPIDSLVKDSAEYSEVMYSSGLIDARGKMPDGTFWRERTSFGEATHYRDVDQRTAQLLDRLIDGDCHKE